METRPKINLDFSGHCISKQFYQKNCLYNRPFRKNYHKLNSDEKSSTYEEEEIVNHGSSFKNNNIVENSTSTDTDFTDNEIDNKDNDFTDDSDFEALTCNVCDRMFACPKQLSSHKQKKRHFGCSACDNIFPSLMSLEHHKDEFEHWSDEEDYLTDSEEEDESVSEECERLI
ncbi:uncharacterized protein LOC130895980 isoform X2 [Diorhabda carinulata]|uniref:uncharacterized protein LOC130895980 isoform X2 n=1 Tax=Diorhabda carinulata TaxID=1163345 RepID=UPI0025A255DE|nr:uncharacterized protein LOC130895980 isoform X2 [Diorhabda carinulata]